MAPCVSRPDGRWIGRSPSQGRVQIGCGLRLMQPAFVVGDDCGGADHPDTWLSLLDQHMPTGELLAERTLAVGANDLD